MKNKKDSEGLETFHTKYVSRFQKSANGKIGSSFPVIASNIKRMENTSVEKYDFS